jgi:hypothetical protein
MNSKEADMCKRFFSLGFTLALFWSSAFVLAQEPAQAPSFKDGDTWQFNITRQGGAQNVTSTDFNDGKYELMFTHGGVKLYQVEESQKNELAINQEGPTQGSLTLIGKSDQRANLKFPLSVGQKWTYSYRQKPAGARRDVEFSVEISVTGIEQVATPAGTFKAYKLVGDTTWRGQGRSTSTYFYSPETKSIIKRSNRNENTGGTVEAELVKFTPGS